MEKATDRIYENSIASPLDDGRGVQRKRWGLFAVGLTGSIAVGLSIVTYPFVSPAFRKICLPYVPATSRQIDNILKILKRKEGTFIDLGSGDGRIVIAAAQRGFFATGVELNPWLVTFSKVKASVVGLRKRARFMRSDIFKVSLTNYDHIVVFGVPDLMPPLLTKLQKEMHVNATVAACRFPFSACKPSEIIEDGIDSVWLYNHNDLHNSVISNTDSNDNNCIGNF